MTETTAEGSAPAPARRQSARARWMKQLYRWHWISSALCLVGMLLFALTGITLNHAGSIVGKAETVRVTQALPDELAAALTREAASASDGQPLPRALRRTIGEALGRDIPATAAEWSVDEIYLPLPRPGGDAWLAIDLASATLEYERTDRGLVAWLNDLHKGRNTGIAWSWFIDLFSVACLVFSLTGLAILWLHARNRPMVWPVVAVGALLPALLILLFIH
ncbi:hypothetical protein C0099_13180 [Pseudazoarcus pumilus]|uniref:Peptidase n=2 Tax=Pseudazoarcus pumilus TaxID=2067960 RepID=A0A2I6SB58_9RHOO|nr:hypothetical protein C0099_13180 [Pseudazoarcus pumilus]